MEIDEHIMECGESRRPRQPSGVTPSGCEVLDGHCLMLDYTISSLERTGAYAMRQAVRT